MSGQKVAPQGVINICLFIDFMLFMYILCFKKIEMSVQVRAFGKEKTEIFDEMKMTELKLESPKRKSEDNMPIFYHWEDLNVHTPGSNPNSVLSKLPCRKKIESRHIIKNG